MREKEKKEKKKKEGGKKIKNKGKEKGESHSPTLLWDSVAVGKLAIQGNTAGKKKKERKKKERQRTKKREKKAMEATPNLAFNSVLRYDAPEVKREEKRGKGRNINWGKRKTLPCRRWLGSSLLAEEKGEKARKGPRKKKEKRREDWGESDCASRRLAAGFIYDNLARFSNGGEKKRKRKRGGNI